MPEETGTRFSGSQAPVLPTGAGSVEADVLLAKMRPGQSIDLEAHCIKGARLRPHRGWGGAPAAAGPSTEVLQADMQACTPKLVFSAVLNRCERRKEWTRPCAQVKGFQWRNPPRTWCLAAWGARPGYMRCHIFDRCLLHSGSTSLKCEVSHWGFRF